ncbi:Uncharacterised protein [Yersinia pseudotuberculosis]|uniref:Uncharacterized protein n=1 Tax=Yersinia pseudotuberculosis TaxID=633 RepID=A0A380Q9J3_YERPU|nr:Uncharacterised protein [Yersinia pseudotuberculosis]
MIHAIHLPNLGSWHYEHSKKTPCQLIAHRVGRPYYRVVNRSFLFRPIYSYYFKY